MTITAANTSAKIPPAVILAAALAVKSELLNGQLDFLQPALFPAPMSRQRSPTRKEEPSATPHFSAAWFSSFGRGLWQSHASEEWCGQT